MKKTNNYENPVIGGGEFKQNSGFKNIICGLLIFSLILGLSGVVSASPILRFEPPTPANGTVTANTSVIINVSIIEANLNEFKFNWNGTNITFAKQELAHFYTGNTTNDSILTTYNYQTGILNITGGTAKGYGLVLAMSFENKSWLNESYRSSGNNGRKVYDYSGRNNIGTISDTNNNMVWNSNGGKYGGAFSFDGSDDYVDCGSGSSLEIYGTNNPVSMEAWIKFGDAGASDLIIHKGTYPTYEYGFATDVNSIFDFRVNDNGSFNLVQDTTAVDTNWHHWVGVYNTTNLLLYKDSSLVKSVSHSGVVSRDTYPLIIGCYVPTEGRYWFKGIIDEVRIYNRSLSAAEISMHYYSNLQKYNSTQGYFYTNVTNLTQGTYTYYGWANDSAGYANNTETRTLTIGYKIINLPSGFSVVLTGDNTTNLSQVGRNGVHNVSIRNATTNATICEVEINFTGSDRNFSNAVIEEGTLNNLGYGICHIPDEAGKVPGSSKVLYIPVINGVGTVCVDSDARNGTDIQNLLNNSCLGGEFVINPPIVTVNGIQYYKITSNRTGQVNGTGGIELGNARLNISDDTDIVTKYQGQAIQFYGNYTNVTSNQPITQAMGGQCNLTFNGTAWYPMQFNATGTGVYNYSASFAFCGTFNYNISCGAVNFNALNTNDTVVVSCTAQSHPVPALNEIGILILIILAAALLVTCLQRKN